jgi:hypothetical protein
MKTLKKQAPIDAWVDNTLAANGRLENRRVIATVESVCNLRCEHCYWSHNIGKARKINWDEPVKTLKSLSVPLFFAGRILNETSARFLRTVIEQNATPELGIVDNGLTILDYPEFFPRYSSINISIDGWKQDHDKQRGRSGLFDIALETLLELHRLGLDPVVSSAISPITVGNWQKFEEILTEHNIPMSATLVWDLPETAKRGTAVFASESKIREAFELLVTGMPKLINLYSLDHVRILSEQLAQFSWKQGEGGDCLTTTLHNGTIILYRPVSVVSVVELDLEWDGVFYTPPTYGLKHNSNAVPQGFFAKVQEQRNAEFELWSHIAPNIKPN